jgi:hypothetical protein
LTSGTDNYAVQGSDSVAGHNYAVGWYGTVFQALFDQARIGYPPTATQMLILMRRSSSGGAGGGVQLLPHLHKQTDYTGAVPQRDYASTSQYLVLNQIVWVTLPTHYFARLAEGEYRGVSFGGTAPQNYIFLWKPISAAGTLDGQPVWTIKVNHSG